MKYAVIKSGGKQYQAIEGKTLQIELLETLSGPVVFDQVLLLVDGDKFELGAPTLPGVKVYATIVSQVKATKIEVFKYKSKSRYRKHTGHRQKLLKVKIDSIGAAPKKPTTAKPKGRSVKKTAK